MANPPLGGTQLALRLPHVAGTPAHNFTMRTGRSNQYARTPSFTALPGSVKNFTLLVQDTQVRRSASLQSTAHNLTRIMQFVACRDCAETGAVMSVE